MNYKRLFDIIFSLLFLIVFLPLMGLIAVVLRVFQGSPIIYCKKVIGLNEKPFGMFKFRTMVKDANIKKIDVFGKRLFGEKPKIDSRTTKMGAFLRKTSIDELPQLFNVLRGDMSLVGLRPRSKQIINSFSKKRKAMYLLLKPGITGIAQATNRNLDNFSREREDLERIYCDNHSLILDMIILFRTIFALFKGR